MFKKGDPKPPNSGRKKNVGNKSTGETRELFAKIVADQVPNLVKRLEEIDNPKDYIDAVYKLSRLVFPNYQSVEFRGTVEAKTAQTDLLKRLNDITK